MSNNNILRPENMEDVFKKETLEIIMPFRANSNIWNNAKYNIDHINTEEGKVILITEKKAKEI